MREKARAYMKDGQKVPTNPAEFYDMNFGYDVFADCERAVAKWAMARGEKTNGLGKKGGSGLESVGKVDEIKDRASLEPVQASL